MMATCVKLVAPQPGGTIYTDGVSYDPVGNVMSRVSTHASLAGGSGSGGRETQNYCYDEQNRLVWASNNVAASSGVGEHCGTATLQAQLGGHIPPTIPHEMLAQDKARHKKNVQLDKIQKKEEKKEKLNPQEGGSGDGNKGNNPTANSGGADDDYEIESLKVRITKGALKNALKKVGKQGVEKFKKAAWTERKVNMMGDVPVAIQDIVERLVLLSESQKLIEQAKEGYANWYANERDDMPHQPEEVKMQFWRQTLFFQRGNRLQLNPSITTSIKMVVENQEFGAYHLITCLDGTDDDDILSWGEPLFYELPDAYDLSDVEGLSESVGPVDPSIGVPESMRALFPQLWKHAEQQELFLRTEQRCWQWFQEHPLWFEHYPQSLVESPNPHSRWFHDHPRWFQGYPVVQFPKSREVRTGFDRLLLCFNHAEVKVPHLLTRLDVFVGEYTIGQYCLAIDTHGRTIEHLSGIFPFPFFC